MTGLKKLKQCKKIGLESPMVVKLILKLMEMTKLEKLVEIPR